MSYHQQQGGLQRLTADIAGIQFNDPDALFRHITKQSAKRSADEQASARPEPISPADNADDTATNQKDAQIMQEENATLKRFRLVHLLGTGNYSRVYKSQTSKGRDIAVKAINLNKISDNYKQKFLPRELSVLKRLCHNNICKIYEIIKVYDRIYIVMQYCPRGTIADLLHRLGPFSEPIARYLFTQTLDAVSYMHSLDIAHRDLKIENILLTTDFTAKLTDFSYSVCLTPVGKQTVPPLGPSVGPAASKGPKQQGQQQGSMIKSFQGIKLNETFCGTLPYLSPEMMRLTLYDAKRTDIWSLGVSLFVMLNDRLPFPFTDAKIMFRKQMCRDYKFRTNCDFCDQLKDFMSAMLEPDWVKRPGCSELARHAWCHMPKERPPS